MIAHSQSLIFKYSIVWNSKFIKDINNKSNVSKIEKKLMKFCTNS